MLRARDFRQSAWNKLSQTDSWLIMVVITLINSLILGACTALSAVAVGGIALLLLSGPLTLGFVMVALDVSRARQAQIERLFDGFKNFVSAFLLALTNAIFIFLWSLLFIIPGIIKAYAYSMSTYILADNPSIGVNEARERSIEMMKGNKWRLFCLHCSFIGWWILCVLTVGILTLWVTPYMQVAVAEFYHDVSGCNANVANGGNGINVNNGGSAFGTDYNKSEASEAECGTQTDSDKPAEDDGMFGYAGKPVNLDDLDSKE